MSTFSVSNSNGRFTLTLTVTQTGQSVENNTTTLKVSLDLKANTAYNFEKYKIGRVATVDGINVIKVARSDSESLEIKDYGTLNLGTGTITVKHKDDGTKTVPISYSIDMESLDYTPGSIGGNGSMNLTTIPRATQPSIASNITMGTAYTIWLPRASTAFTHKVYYTFGSITKSLINSSAGASCSWTPNVATLAPQVNNSASGSGTIICETYASGTLVGTKTAPFTATVPENDDTKPSISSFALSPVNTTGNYVQGMSSVKGVFTASGKYGASIKTYKLTVAGTTVTSSSSAVTSGLVTSSGTVSVTGTVVDSRGFSSQYSTTIDVIPYGKPFFTSHPTYGTLLVCRADSSKNIKDSGTNILVRMRVKWYSLQGGSNGLSATLKCAGLKTTNTGLSVTVGGTSSYISWCDYDLIVPGIELDIDQSYTVTIKVTDGQGSSETYETIIPTAKVALHLADGGNGACFGGYSTVDGAVDFKFDVVGNAYGLGNLPSLSYNDDFNDYVTPGCYAVIHNNMAETIANIPSNIAGVLVVWNGSGERNGSEERTGYTYRVQEYKLYNGSASFRRLATLPPNSSTWTYSEWRKFAYTPERSTHPIAAGTYNASSTWYKITHSDGLVELRARVKFSGLSCTTAGWGALYTAAITGSDIAYPFTFYTAPVVNVTAEAYEEGGGNCFLATCDLPGTTTKAPKYQIVRGSAGNVSLYLNYYVIGY